MSNKGVLIVNLVHTGSTRTGCGKALFAPIFKRRSCHRQAALDVASDPTRHHFADKTEEISQAVSGNMARRGVSFASLYEGPSEASAGAASRPNCSLCHVLQ